MSRDLCLYEIHFETPYMLYLKTACFYKYAQTQIFVQFKPFRCYEI